MATLGTTFLAGRQTSLVHSHAETLSSQENCSRWAGPLPPLRGFKAGHCQFKWRNSIDSSVQVLRKAQAYEKGRDTMATSSQEAAPELNSSPILVSVDVQSDGSIAFLFSHAQQSKELPKANARVVQFLRARSVESLAPISLEMLADIIGAPVDDEVSPSLSSAKSDVAEGGAALANPDEVQMSETPTSHDFTSSPGLFRTEAEELVAVQFPPDNDSLTSSQSQQQPGSAEHGLAAEMAQVGQVDEPVEGHRVAVWKPSADELHAVRQQVQKLFGPVVGMESSSLSFNSSVDPVQFQASMKRQVAALDSAMHLQEEENGRIALLGRTSSPQFHARPPNTFARGGVAPLAPPTMASDAAPNSEAGASVWNRQLVRQLPLYMAACAVGGAALVLGSATSVSRQYSSSLLPKFLVALPGLAMFWAAAALGKLKVVMEEALAKMDGGLASQKATNSSLASLQKDCLQNMLMVMAGAMGLSSVGRIFV